jgi:hypothetical protein
VFPLMFRKREKSAKCQESLKLHIALYASRSTELFLSYAKKVEHSLALTNTNSESFNSEHYRDEAFIEPSMLSTIESHAEIKS